MVVSYCAICVNVFPLWRSNAEWNRHGWRKFERINVKLSPLMPSDGAQSTAQFHFCGFNFTVDHFEP